MRKEVMCKDFSMWNMSLSMLLGKSPKVEIICGDCGNYFTKRFDMSEVAYRTPRAICTCCGTINRIPITIE